MSFRRNGLRHRLAALTLAYLLALQGALVAWGTVAAVASSASPDPTVICSSHHRGGPLHQSDDPLPCCTCGPMCLSAGAAVLAAPDAAAIAQPLTVTDVRWAAGTAETSWRVQVIHWQARAPPATA